MARLGPTTSALGGDARSRGQWDRSEAHRRKQNGTGWSLPSHGESTRMISTSARAVRVCGWPQVCPRQRSCTSQRGGHGSGFEPSRHGRGETHRAGWQRRWVQRSGHSATRSHTCMSAWSNKANPDVVLHHRMRARSREGRPRATDAAPVERPARHTVPGARRGAVSRAREARAERSHSRAHLFFRLGLKRTLSPAKFEKKVNHPLDHLTT